MYFRQLTRGYIYWALGYTYVLRNAHAGVEQVRTRVSSQAKFGVDF